MSDQTASTSRSHFWREQIEAWQASGQSQRAFCEAHDLNYPNFGYWLRKFRRQAVSNKSTGFVPVTSRASFSTGGLSLMFPNGIELRGIAPDNLNLVHQLLSRLS